MREFRSRVKAALRRAAMGAGEPTRRSGARTRPTARDRRARDRLRQAHGADARRARADDLRRVRDPRGARAPPRAGVHARVLLERIWGDSAYRDPRTIDVHIRHLREKVERDPKEPEYLFTVRGVGYRFRERRAMKRGRRQAMARSRPSRTRCARRPRPMTRACGVPTTRAPRGLRLDQVPPGAAVLRDHVRRAGGGLRVRGADARGRGCGAEAAGSLRSRRNGYTRRLRGRRTAADEDRRELARAVHDAAAGLQRPGDADRGRERRGGRARQDVSTSTDPRRPARRRREPRGQPEFFRSPGQAARNAQAADGDGGSANGPVGEAAQADLRARRADRAWRSSRARSATSSERGALIRARMLIAGRWRSRCRCWRLSARACDQLARGSPGGGGVAGRRR